MVILEKSPLKDFKNQKKKDLIKEAGIPLAFCQKCKMLHFSYPACVVWGKMQQNFISKHENRQRGFHVVRRKNCAEIQFKNDFNIESKRKKQMIQ